MPNAAGSTHAPAPAAPERPAWPDANEALPLLAESAEHRAELAALELAEARRHALVSLLLAVTAAVLLLLAGMALTLLVAALVWTSPYRAWWLAGLALLHLGLAASAAAALRRRLHGWRPLAETCTQLREDYRCLHELLVRAVR